MLGFILQEYKPYMFWMNMIDAFYQSLVCFFIPYFVSFMLHFHQLMSLSVFACCCFYSIMFSSVHTLILPLTAPQAYADSDVDLFTWGTPITTIALFTILMHLGIETKTWVREMPSTPVTILLPSLFSYLLLVTSLLASRFYVETDVKPEIQSKSPRFHNCS